MRGALVRFILAVAIAPLPGAYAAPEAAIEIAATSSSGDWQIKSRVDSVTGARLTNVLVPSRKTMHSSLAAAPRSLLQFGCLKGQLVVHLQFAFQVGSKADAEIVYRFDQRPAHVVEARILRGLRIVLIERKAEVVQFLDELATANVLHLVINSMAKGRTSAEFVVSGAQAAIDAAVAGCPVKARS